MRLHALILTLVFATSANAYEVETHGAITLNAFDYSVLGNNNPGQADLYRRLGFDRVDLERPFFQVVGPQCDVTGLVPQVDGYVDPDPAWLASGNPDSSNRRIRCPQQYERNSMNPQYRGLVGSNLGSTPQLRLEAWLMRGVIREDDLETGNYVGPVRPDPDPWGEEDRPIHHFYVAPANEAGTFLLESQPSLRWAMGEDVPLATNGLPDPARGNHFSYMDARRNLYLALTYKSDGATTGTLRQTDSLLRQNLWASTMKALGHVIHLMQDQSSPQHARAERHNYVCRGLFSGINSSIATRTYENFINYRLINRLFGNQAEQYVATNICEEELWFDLFLLGGQARPPEVNSWFRGGVNGNTYPTPQFAVQRRFFTTRANDGLSVFSTPPAILNSRNGLGDYSNRGFYTELNMEGGNIQYLFVSPPRDPEDLSFVDSELTPVNVPGKGVVKRKALYWQVPDNVAPTYPDQNLVNGKVPIVSYGQWGFIGGIGSLGIKRRILTLDNYNQMADMLIPRAVAYTEGFLNFFFRGKLIVEAPLDGLFGAIDHSIPHTVDADGYPRCSSTVTFGPDTWCIPGRIYGFTKLRLKVRNDTATITESGGGPVVPQTMVATVANPTTGTNAGLYAIARYHRNLCYRRDLSSERTIDANGVIGVEPSNCTSRTLYQEISVSKPKVATAGELNGSTSAALTFDFSDDPIPINATDLIIQVLYRGQLGQETDGIAVGSFDVKEPSYVTVWNNTDWGACNGNWVQTFGAGCTPAGTTARVMTTTNLCIGSQLLLFHTGSIQGNLTSGKYVRVAVLLDGRTVTTRARVVLGVGGTFSLFSKVIRGQVRQGTKEIITASAPYEPEPMFLKRGRIGSFRPTPVHLVSGADAQPPNDAGPQDVGNLLPVFPVTELPNEAEFQFPDVATSVGVCPLPDP